jgi:hypothetical protein
MVFPMDPPSNGASARAPAPQSRPGRSVTSGPVADTEMLIAPDNQGAGWSGLGRGEPSDRLAERAILVCTESLPSVYLAVPPRPQSAAAEGRSEKPR